MAIHTRGRLVVAAFWSAGVVVVASGARSQEQDLGQAANDPTASVAAYQLQYFNTPDFSNSASADSSRLQFRAATPFKLGGYNNIFRVTVPYVFDSPGGADGLGDITLFNLVTFDQPWGRFGIGAVGLLPTGASGVSAEKWGLGPAAGFVASKPWGIWGLFNQNIFSVAGDDSFRDVDISIIQPILNLSLGNGWSVGTSDMSITYDWEANDWVSLPFGVGVNKLVTVGGLPWQFSASYEHNLYDEGIAPENTFNLTVKILVPK